MCSVSRISGSCNDYGMDIMGWVNSREVIALAIVGHHPPVFELPLYLRCNESLAIKTLIRRN